MSSKFRPSFNINVLKLFEIKAEIELKKTNPSAILAPIPIEKPFSCGLVKIGMKDHNKSRFQISTKNITADFLIGKLPCPCFFIISKSASLKMLFVLLKKPVFSISLSTKLGSLKVQNITSEL
ncbi:hypothetical protein LPB88_19495 [Flavobacterium sp. JAS]|nr:hypothetical protein [Flavobacterium sp. JAS]